MACDCSVGPGHCTDDVVSDWSTADHKCTVDCKKEAHDVDSEVSRSGSDLYDGGFRYSELS